MPDINECEHNLGKCLNGKCINTDGSYMCACNEGYKLNPENHRECIGKLFFLLFLYIYLHLFPIYISAPYRMHVYNTCSFNLIGAYQLLSIQVKNFTMLHIFSFIFRIILNDILRYIKIEVQYFMYQVNIH